MTTIRERIRTLRGRVPAIVAAPLLVVIALGAWAFASPVGGSPDDDFHLASIWCADVIAPDCAPGESADQRIVPEALIGSGCYNRDPEQSAACQDSTVSFDVSDTVQTTRGNFAGNYPPVFYAVMGLFATSDIPASVVVMRLVNVILFAGISTALYLLLAPTRRAALLWGWLVATVPLGIYIIPSVNPSSWAVIGVASSWLALLGWYESRGRRKIGLGAVFAIGVVMAAGSRSDAAVFAALGMAVVAVLTVARSRRWALDSILPLVALAVCVVSFVTSGQTVSAASGYGASPIDSGPVDVGAGGEPAPAPDPLSLLAFNLLNVPSIWAGALGTWGLGWFDVAMPFVVGFASIACYVALGFTGFRSMSIRKALAAAAVGLALIVVPVYVLTRGGSSVGVEVQPRYVLPLMVLLAGLLALRTGARTVELARGQLALVVVSLAVVQFIALHTTMRRYITGVDAQGASLDAGIEWWWAGVPSPNVVLVVGSLCYGGAVVLLASAANRAAAATPPRGVGVPA